MKQPTLRPASATDRDWLYEVHRASMRRYVKETWGWDEAWQASHFEEHFEPEGLQIVRYQDRDVGFFRVSDRPDRIVLETLELLPSFQGLGIGSVFIRTLQQSASERRIPVVLQVLKANHRAKVLYERLGFRVSDETETHYVMESTIAAGAV